MLQYAQNVVQIEVWYLTAGENLRFASSSYSVRYLKMMLCSFSFDCHLPLIVNSNVDLKVRVLTFFSVKE